MKKIWLVIISAAVLVALVVGFTGCDSGDPVVLANEDGSIQVTVNTQQQGIWVSGNGSVMATPDIAMLSLGIEVQSDTVAQAQAEAVVAMDSVMSALLAQGVAEEDIQTQQYSVRELYEWEIVYDDEGKEVITGYEVTNTVTVKVREIDNVGAIIDAVVAAGGNYTRVNSIYFSVDDPSPYYEAARAEAMEYAQAKAAQLAELSGVTLGDPTYISESTSYSPNYYRSEVAYDESGAGVETSISAGELEITASVQIAYSIG